MWRFPQKVLVRVTACARTADLLVCSGDCRTAWCASIGRARRPDAAPLRGLKRPADCSGSARTRTSRCRPGGLRSSLALQSPTTPVQGQALRSAFHPSAGDAGAG